MADPFGKPFAADAEVTGKEADYSHFAEMLASVMLLREGGVEKALESVPMLHDETHAYIKTVSLLSKSEFNLTNWKGMSASGVASIAGKSGKNITGGDYAAKNDALKQSGVDLMNKLNATGKLVVDPAVDEKLAPVTASMNALGDKIAGTDEAFIADVRRERGERDGRRDLGLCAAALLTRPHPLPPPPLHSSTPSSTSTTSRSPANRWGSRPSSTTRRRSSRASSPASRSPPPASTSRPASSRTRPPVSSPARPR
jgi:hypothetical protein